MMLTSVDSIQHWAVIPASGVGQRMQADRPKQYLPLSDKTILQHTLERLLSHPEIDGAVLVLGEEDPLWERLQFSTDKPLLICHGGAQRQHSVYNGLLALHEHTKADPMVLIHDAVRPFVSHDDLSRLIELAGCQPDGALLAAPVADTLKLADDQAQVVQTQDRHNLWRALTPQAFRLSTILAALKSAIDQDLAITDDASAMELAGYHPRLVSSSSINFKITTADDLLLARYIVQIVPVGNSH